MNKLTLNRKKINKKEAPLHITCECGNNELINLLDNNAK